jgi:ABC-type glutathione transport system ATPase component
VSDVSFSVAAGEVFGFLGPNGAGKTTTVRILGTPISPTAGSAVVAGIPVGPDGAAEIRRRIAVMPKSPGLYQRLTVTENLEYFARLYDLPRRQERITEAATRRRCRSAPRCSSSMAARRGSRPPCADAHRFIRGRDLVVEIGCFSGYRPWCQGLEPVYSGWVCRVMRLG